MTQEPEAQPSQVNGAFFFCGFLLVIHAAAFMGAGPMGLFALGNLVICCLLLPIASLAGCLIPRSSKGWRWAQVVPVTVVAFLFSFIQLMIVAAASAAV